jgi:hypothetical protein
LNSKCKSDADFLVMFEMLVENLSVKNTEKPRSHVFWVPSTCSSWSGEKETLLQLQNFQKVPYLNVLCFVDHPRREGTEC